MDEYAQVNSLAAVALAISALLIAACSAQPSVQAPTPTAQPTWATVTDLAVAFEPTEADAVAPHARGSLGSFTMGCTLEVLKVTDRAVRVTKRSCPSYDTLSTAPAGVQGWVAKSALSLH